jgi:hypothetical protein
MAATGFSPVFTLSRWAGAVMGIVLAVASLTMRLGRGNKNFDGTDNAFWLFLGCLIVSSLLAHGPGSWQPDEDYAPVSYGQAVRWWTFWDMIAAFLFAKVMKRINRFWKQQDEDD